MDMMDRCNRLDDMIRQDRLLRNFWQCIDDDTGIERACLLVALAPEVKAGILGNCPAWVMPAWMSHITMWIDDDGTDDEWLTIVKRYATVARRWHVLDKTGWQNIRVNSRIMGLKEAMKYFPDCDEHDQDIFDKNSLDVRNMYDQAIKALTYRDLNSMDDISYAAEIMAKGLGQYHSSNIIILARILRIISIASAFSHAGHIFRHVASLSDIDADIGDSPATRRVADGLIHQFLGIVEEECSKAEHMKSLVK